MLVTRDSKSKSLLALYTGSVPFVPRPPAGVYGAGSGLCRKPSLGYVVAVGFGGRGAIDGASTDVVRAPVVVAGPPVYGPCMVTLVTGTVGGSGTGAAMYVAGALIYSACGAAAGAARMAGARAKMAEKVETVSILLLLGTKQDERRGR